MADLLKKFFNNSVPSSVTSNQKIPMQESKEPVPIAVIKVVGVGGGGGNAVNRMYISKISDVELMAINSDSQALHNLQVEKVLTIGKATTAGLGAGASPDIGKKAAEESSEQLKAELEGADMLFLTAGMGGGTGTGATPVIAELTRSLGILTVGVVTKPFSFEGARRCAQAIEGIDNLKNKVDSLIVIPNDKILSIIDKKTPLTDAFMVVDDVLRQAVQGISDLVTIHGLINVDFADVRSIMQNSGPALMGIGYGNGENRAVEAARAAIDSPLLEMSINGAKGIIFNVTGGTDLSMFEVDEAARVVSEAADPEANVIFGAVINENFTGEIKCTVVATGFDEVAQESITGTSAADASSIMRKLGGVSQNLSPSSSQSDGVVARPTGTRLGQTSPQVETDLEVPAFMRRKIKPVAKDSAA